MNTRLQKPCLCLDQHFYIDVVFSGLLSCYPGLCGCCSSKHNSFGQPRQEFASRTT